MIEFNIYPDYCSTGIWSIPDCNVLFPEDIPEEFADRLAFWHDIWEATIGEWDWQEALASMTRMGEADKKAYTAHLKNHRAKFYEMWYNMGYELVEELNFTCQILFGDKYKFNYKADIEFRD